VKKAISPRREENFAEWYQQVIKAADLADNAAVRGCMVIKPWGYGIWENIQAYLDKKIKAEGHENAYFPLFIPLSFLEREADHVEGFAKECAIVTHHRLEKKEGKLIPAAPLEEPLVVRPTSETIIGDSFSKWIKSWRDLPLLINQWANVVRWEMRPRLFLRTSEFLWQEGHTVHASSEEALGHSLKMLTVYQRFMEDILAIPVIVGKKSEGERFPGAEETFTTETMMQDGKALQAGTSHYLGQNFSKAQDITFSNKEGLLEHGYTTSWGVTTRLIGALIMCHGDDDGLRLPPKIAPKQVVILPVIPKAEMEASVLNFCEKVQKNLQESSLRVHLDKREIRGGEKSWEWIKKGVPIRVEIGPRDIEKGQVILMRRDQSPQDKQIVAVKDLQAVIETALEEMQNNLFKEAKAFQESHMHQDITTFEELKSFFESNKKGFVKAKWCGEKASEEILKSFQATVRCIPFEQSGTEGICVVTGKKATLDAIFAKAY
jgi:prolyl-tRNA synthetase